MFASGKSSRVEDAFTGPKHRTGPAPSHHCSVEASEGGRAAAGMETCATSIDGSEKLCPMSDVCPSPFTAAAAVPAHSAAVVSVLV